METQLLNAKNVKPGIYFSNRAAVSTGQIQRSKYRKFPPMKPGTLANKNIIARYKDQSNLNSKERNTAHLTISNGLNIFECIASISLKNESNNISQQILANNDICDRLKETQTSGGNSLPKKTLEWEAFCVNNWGYVVDNTLHFGRDELVSIYNTHYKTSITRIEFRKEKQNGNGFILIFFCASGNQGLGSIQKAENSSITDNMTGQKFTPIYNYIHKHERSPNYEYMVGTLVYEMCLKDKSVYSFQYGQNAGLGHCYTTVPLFKYSVSREVHRKMSKTIKCSAGPGRKVTLLKTRCRKRKSPRCITNVKKQDESKDFIVSAKEKIFKSETCPASQLNTRGSYLSKPSNNRCEQSLIGADKVKLMEGEMPPISSFTGVKQCKTGQQSSNVEYGFKINKPTVVKRPRRLHTHTNDHIAVESPIRKKFAGRQIRKPLKKNTSETGQVRDSIGRLLKKESCERSACDAKKTVGLKVVNHPQNLAFMKMYARQEYNRDCHRQAIIKRQQCNIKRDLLKRLYTIDRESAVNELTKIMGIS
jgi:hypothetical protein